MFYEIEMKYMRTHIKNILIV